ncbi:MAG TPA: universal stress protein [Actinocrinis sp.]|nr:universal stress protein [Actinocrinis sp.]
MTENTVTPGTPAAERIVVGVDFSDNAARAAHWAAREAADRGLALHLVHALDLPGGPGELIEPAGYAKAGHEAGADLLAEIAGAIRGKDPALTVTSEVSEIGAAESLVELSRNARLVVTGTRGHGGFAGLLLGSVSLKVAAHAHCPTAVVRGQQAGEPLNEIVLGVEPDQAEAPIRFAFDSAARFGATLTAVRGWPSQTEYGGYYFAEDFDARAQAEQADLTALLEAVRADYPDVPVTMHAVSGNPVPILIGASVNTRLLVVGSHHHHGPLSLGAGYVVQGLLAHSPAPVAVVPIG